jgi:hypothetical protein
MQTLRGKGVLHRVIINHLNSTDDKSEKKSYKKHGKQKKEVRHSSDSDAKGRSS